MRAIVEQAFRIHRAFKRRAELPLVDAPANLSHARIGTPDVVHVERDALVRNAQPSPAPPRRHGTAAFRTGWRGVDGRRASAPTPPHAPRSEPR